MTSSKATKRFCVHSFSYNEAQPSAWCHCAAHEDTSNDMYGELEFTLRSRGLKSTVNLDLMRSLYTYEYFDAYQRMDLDRAVICALAWFV